jgi:Tfp pilus assembly protein PilV
MVNNHRSGLALIDVIIGSAMLAVGLAVVISMSSRSLVHQGNAERQITASWLADELLTMVLVVGPDEYAKSYPDSGRFESPFQEFVYEIEFEDDSLYLPVKSTATIFWDVSGNEHTITVETLIARRQGEPVDRMPVEVVDREARYWEEIESRANE